MPPLDLQPHLPRAAEFYRGTAQLDDALADRAEWARTVPSAVPAT